MEELSATYQKIIDSAEFLFFQKGIKAVSMDDVCQNIQISKKTIYKVFSDKESLVKATLMKHFHLIENEILKIEATEPHPIKQLLITAEFAIEQLSKVNPVMNQDLKKYHPLVYQQMVKTRGAFIENHLLKNIELGRKLNCYRTDFDMHAITKAFSLLLYATTDSISSGESSFSPTVINDVINYHLRGISNSDGQKQLESINTHE